MTAILTNLGEALFLTLVANPFLAVLTALFAVAIWILPNRLLKDTDTKR